MKGLPLVVLACCVWTRNENGESRLLMSPLVRLLSPPLVSAIRGITLLSFQLQSWDSSDTWSGPTRVGGGYRNKDALHAVKGIRACTYTSTRLRACGSWFAGTICLPITHVPKFTGCVAYFVATVSDVACFALGRVLWDICSGLKSWT